MPINLRKIEFFNREKEAEEIMNVLESEPRVINFVYGPINSGKTTLITNLIENLPEDYVIFNINLRGRFISNYHDFVRVLFDVEKDKDLKEILKKLMVKSEKAIYRTGGLPAPESLLETFFGEGSHEDVFKFLEGYFKNIAKEKTPVLILDELQVIGDLKINGHLIYELFNFFIRLTKELHLCHVFAISSDSLFIEKVYGEAMLQKRCSYLLVDNFDEQITEKFLNEYNFSKREKDMVWNHVGGNPAMLIEAIDAKINKKSISERLNRRLNIEKGKLRQELYYVKNIGKTIPFGETTIKLSYKKIIEVMENFKDNDSWEYKAITPEIAYLTSENVIFADPLKTIIKPQSKLDLIVIREVLKESEK